MSTATQSTTLTHPQLVLSFTDIDIDIWFYLIVYYDIRYYKVMLSFFLCFVISKALSNDALKAFH